MRQVLSAWRGPERKTLPRPLGPPNHFVGWHGLTSPSYTPLWCVFWATIYTDYQRSLDPFYRVSYHINWVETSWTFVYVPWLGVRLFVVHPVTGAPPPSARGSVGTTLATQGSLQTWETHYMKLRLFFIDPFHRLQRGDNTLGNKARHRGSTNIISFLLNYIQLIVFRTTILKFSILLQGR